MERCPRCGTQSPSAGPGRLVGSSDTNVGFVEGGVPGTLICATCGHRWRFKAPAFFVPAAVDAVQAERVLAAVRAHVLKHNGPSTERRIWKLEYRHNGEHEVAEVGLSSHGSDGEVVVAILEGNGIYYICTPTRAVVSGEPIFVGANSVMRAVDFA